MQRDSFSRLEASPQCYFLSKKAFLDMVEGSACTNFPVCIGFNLARGETLTENTHIYMSKHRNIPSDCLPFVDLQNSF